MPPIVVQLAGVKTSLELVPDGTYPANMTKVTFGMSKTQNPKVTLEFVFTGEAGEEIAGRKAWVECSLQTQALFKIKRTLVDLGMDPDELEGPVDLDAALNAMLGCEATIKVGHHDYQGNAHNDFYVISPDSWSGN